ncbi:unconventional myosin-IXb-like [Heptranchias perlo]|uniref:unconventional myosin-IXb-like n=1 Tax=Heptranchias perlo TaxID=212740 RepID=UPI00355A5429
MSVKDACGTDHRGGKVYTLQICPSLYTENSVCCHLPVTKGVTAGEVVQEVTSKLKLDTSKCYVLAEVKESGGEEWILDANDLPVQRVLLWPRRAQESHSQSEGYYFLLQERNSDGTIRYINLQLMAKEREKRRMVERGFLPPQQHLYDDLCNLPRLTEETILQTFKTRFLNKKIYTYAGSILIAINPFRFLPIYNPKYVKMYESHQLGKLEPHIFAIADVAYHTMLRKQVNQCIVISGESGSGKTQSTNFLIHCLTALSQKGYASGVERTILGAGPVLEAFGNAKTAHNNNSSRFGKFIQVNYLENGLVRGAVVEKYLLEKSRLVSQEADERNYHVFYYLLIGASEDERCDFQLKQPEDYYYLNQKRNFFIDDGEDLKHDFERLKQAMEMVGFLHTTKKQIFLALSAILYLGNIVYKKKAAGRDEGLEVGPPEVLNTLSELLKVKRDTLVEALTKRKTVTVGEKLILPYSLNEAITTRDSMAKSLYTALFDWIVLRINHALLNKKDMEDSVTAEEVNRGINKIICLMFSLRPFPRLFYSRSVLDLSFETTCEDFNFEAFEDTFAHYNSKNDLHAQVMRSILGWGQYSNDPQALLKSLKRLERPHSHFLKNKGLKPKLVVPKNLIDSDSLKYIVRMTLYDRTTKSLLHLHKKKKPPSISAQFQASLNKLMETLGKAEPFFIRCIRSNDKKLELCFDDELVLQQLKYTGMLETVRIRRSGYSAKYTFQEFMDQFQVLLPKNAEPVQEAIAALFNRLKLNRDNCQIGKTKVFMKETERQKLQDILHKEVMRKILLLQTWFRAIQERRRFLKMKQAAITIQAYCRSYLVRLALQRNNAASIIQLVWRGHVQKRAYQKQIRGILLCQAASRGYLARKRVRLIRQEQQRVREEAEGREQAMQAEERERDSVPSQSPSDLDTQGVEGSEDSPEPSTEAARDGDSQESWENTTVPSHKPPTEVTGRSNSCREKRENRRMRGLEHDKLQRQLVFPTPQDEPSPPTLDRPVKTMEIVEKMAQNASTMGKGEVKGQLGNRRSLGEEWPENSAPLERTKAEELIQAQGAQRITDSVSNSERMKAAGTPGERGENQHSPIQLKRPKSLPLITGEAALPKKATRERAQAQAQAQAQAAGEENTGQTPRKVPDSPGASLGTIHRYNDHGKLRNKAEKWKDKRHGEVTSPMAEKKENHPHVKSGKNKELLSREDGVTLTLSCSPEGVAETLSKESPTNGPQDGDRTPTKQSVQKKLSQEQDPAQPLESPKYVRDFVCFSLEALTHQEKVTSLS